MKPWLTMVGIGEDGIDGLGPAARAALGDGDMVIGGARHLAMVRDDGRPRHEWPSGTRAMIEVVLARRGQPTLVVTTGDPMWFGVGARLARHVPGAEMRVFPALSTLTLTCARLGWRESDVVTVTLHGRPAAMLEPAIAPGARLLVLSAGPQTPGEVAARLCRRGFGPSRVTVLERLGGPHERVRETPAEAFDIADIEPLNAVAVDCRPGPGASVLACVPGLADQAFAHDGQITKRETRAATLARLMPLPDALLWDIGAGCGSIAVEWMRAAPRTRAIAIEARADRTTLARHNAETLGVPGLDIVEGRAPAALDGLEPPDAVFIGGGIGGPDGTAIAALALDALRPGGRLVANAVTLAGEAALIALHGVHGGELVRLSVARAEPLGGQFGWRALMPVTQWAWQKPWAAT